MTIRIPFWQPSTNSIDAEIGLCSVVRANLPNEGPLTKRWEEEIAQLCGAKYAVATTSGTAALFLALKSLDLPEHSWVKVPDCTFIATANVVRLAGSLVQLVDVSTNLLIPSNTYPPFIPVHVSGRMVKNEASVEDACEAFPCQVGMGITCFSFSPNKIITTGQGGAAVTNDYQLYLKMKQLKDQGRLTSTGGEDVHPCMGWNFKFTDLQAALGLAQLKELDGRIKRLKRNSAIYHNELGNEIGIHLYHAGDIPLWTDAYCEQRDGLLAYLEQQGIQCRKYWRPLHQQPPYLRDDTSFPVSSRLMPKSFWLSSGYTLSDRQVLEVCKHVKDFLRGN